MSANRDILELLEKDIAYLASYFSIDMPTEVSTIVDTDETCRVVYAYAKSYHSLNLGAYLDEENIEISLEHLLSTGILLLSNLGYLLLALRDPELLLGAAYYASIESSTPGSWMIETPFGIWIHE